MRLPAAAPLRRVAFTIQQGDITAFEADVAAFKYAHAFDGADNVVANLLNDRINLNMDALRAPEDEYRLVATGGSLPFAHVLYLGMPPLLFVGYAQLREFGARSLTALAEAAPRTRHVAMTIHGPGFSRDERESFLSQFAGLRDAMQAGTLPPALQQITIVDRVADRVTRLRELLEQTGGLSLTDRRAIPGLPPARADVFPTALATLVAVAEHAKVTAFRHSFYNLRYGLAAELLSAG